MIHGDVVTLTSKGILVQDKALQPLGIFDQSMCSAIWAANPFEQNRQYKYPNLVISPIHPSSWPFLLQLEISISDKEGAFAKVCELLNENRLSILYVECTTAGFNHAFCNVIAESIKPELIELRKRKSDFDREHPYVRTSDCAFKAAQGIANRIAAEMIAHAKEIEDDFNAGGYNFLHSWEYERQSNLFLYDQDEVEEAIKGVKEVKLSISPEERVSYLKGQFPRTAAVRYMQRLAYFSMYGGGPGAPFTLTYHADSALLELDKGKRFTSELKLHGNSEPPFTLGSFPLQAICIFNTQEKYLRLKPVTTQILNNTEKQLTLIDVEYVKDQADQDIYLPNGTRRLFHKIGERLREVNLLHVANKSTRYEHTSKTGVISFVADVPKSNYDNVKASIEGITLSPNAHGDVSAVDVKVHPYPKWKLFVSLHFGANRDKEIRNIIEEVSREYGFEETTVESYVEGSTVAVVESISGCHAFLQVISLKENETIKRVNLPWLPFEHGVALGLNLPNVRMVDRLAGNEEKWRQKLNVALDQRLLEFSSNDERPVLAAKFRRAIGELAERLQNVNISEGRGGRVRR